jgi:hypothetical protein
MRKTTIGMIIELGIKLEQDMHEIINTLERLRNNGTGWERDIHNDGRVSVQILYASYMNMKSRREALNGIEIDVSGPEWYYLTGQKEDIK